MINNRPVLALFFELNGSLELWNSVGFLEREITLYNRLAREYFEKIYFMTYGDATDFKFRGRLESNIIIVPLKKKPGSFLKAFFYELTLPLAQYSILKQCDILKTNQNSGSLAAAITKILFPKKVLVARSGYIGSELGKSDSPILTKIYYFITENIVYRLCNIILIPKNDSIVLKKKYKFLRKKISVHNNFIDTKGFKCESLEKIFDLIYVARFSKGKNHSGLINAVSKLNLSLLFIGDGPEQKNVADLSHQHSLNVTFITSVPNEALPKYYNQSKICVFPSLYEGNPKALLEAMACELPVIGLDVPGVNAIIENGKNGILTEEKALKESVVALLSDTAQQNHLGKNARETVLQSFSFEQILTQEKKIYTNLLNL